MAGVDYGGLLALRSQMEVMSGQCTDWLHEFSLKQAEAVLEQTRQNTPKEMEQLRDSWYVEAIKRKGNNVEVMIRSDMETASLAEYGHTDSSGTRWEEGAFMCTLAVDAVQRAMPASIQHEFSQWANRTGGDV